MNDTVRELPRPLVSIGDESRESWIRRFDLVAEPFPVWALAARGGA